MSESSSRGSSGDLPTIEMFLNKKSTSKSGRPVKRSAADRKALLDFWMGMNGGVKYTDLRRAENEVQGALNDMESDWERDGHSKDEIDQMAVEVAEDNSPESLAPAFYLLKLRNMDLKKRLTHRDMPVKF